MITSPERTLGQVSEALLKNDAIRQSRRGPIKTALKQYSGLLGYSDLNQCPFEAYFQNDDARNRMIDEGASRTTVDNRNGSVHLGPDAVRNLKNNVSFALRKAVELGIISSKQEILSARTQPDFRERPPRHEYVISSKYRLDPIPRRLTDELSEYERFIFVSRRKPLPAAGRHFTDEFVSFPSLSFGCLNRCLSRQLTATSSTFPPFDVVVALALVPDIATVNPLQ